METNLRKMYGEMVSILRADPGAIPRHMNLIKEILAPVAETYGELMTTHESGGIHFIRDGMALADFGAIPLAVCKVHSVEQNQNFIEMMICGQETASQIIKVESEELGSNRWIEKLGVGYVYEKKEIWNLRNLIQILAKYAPVKEEFLYNGWVLDGANFYVWNGRKLCGEDWDAVEAKASCSHVLGMLDVASHFVTVPLLSVAVLSLVHSKLAEKGIFFKGVCCIEAPTQSFKTTLATLFLDFESGSNADINFEATEAAIVRSIGNKRDSVTIVDDYKPGATRAECNQMELKLSKIIRQCSDASGGIQKAGGQNTTVSIVSHCLVVVTAERIQLKVQSSLARLLIFEMDRMSVDRGKLTHFQECHSKYRAFLEGFIMYIAAQQMEEYCKSLSQKFLQERDTLRNKMPGEVIVDNRTNDMCVWLYISFKEFLEYAREAGTVDQKQFNEYMDEAGKVFISIMEQQAERVSELDDLRRFFKGLQALLETGEAHIGQLQARNVGYSVQDSRGAIGFSKKGCIYLKNDTAFREVVSYFHRYGKEFVTSESTLRKLLADRGCINRKNEKSYIHRLYINSETYQCIQFNESKFKELLNGGKRNGAESEVPSNRAMRRNADNLFGRRDEAN